MRFVYVALLLTCTCSIHSQGIEVMKFEPLEKDQTAVMNYRNDNNGNPCALLIVQSLKNGFEFEGWVVGDFERKNDTYWVYIANGAKHVKIKHSNFQTKDVVFGDYGVNTLKGGQAYSLQLVDDTKDIINKVYQLGWNLNEMEVPTSAKTFLNMAATRGDVKAQIAMAQLSLTGKVSVGEFLNENKGLYWINKLLAKGDSTCLESMPGELMYAYACQLIWNGVCYDGLKTDTLKNKSIYTKASEFEIKACLKGFKDAGNELFKDYIKSNGSPQYSKDIIRCCEDSANVGNIEAMNCLGRIYENGICVDVNLNLAAMWYQKIYDIKHTNQSNLCRIYGNKKYLINSENLEFIRMQAEEGQNEALYQLGCMYEEGRNVQQDTKKAIELFNQCTLINDSYHSSHEGAVIHLARILYKKGEYDSVGNLLVYGINKPNMDYTFLKSLLIYSGLHKKYRWAGNWMWTQEDAIESIKSIAKQGHREAQEFLEQINK